MHQQSCSVNGAYHSPYMVRPAVDSPGSSTDDLLSSTPALTPKLMNKEHRAGYARSEDALARAVERELMKRIHIPAFDYLSFVSKTPVCVSDLATSPFISPQNLLYFRLFALLIHLVVIVTGIATRREVFFIQLTNITNIISFVFFTSTTILSIRYLRAPRDPGDADWVVHRASRAAGFSFSCFPIAISLMDIVVSVFWTLILPEFEVHSWIDWLYGVLAHGGTLLCLLTEMWLTRIPILRRFHLHLFCFILCYTLFAFTVYIRTGYLIYALCDITQRINQIMTPFVFILGALSLEFNLLLCRLRESLYGRLQRIGLMQNLESRKPLFGETVVYGDRRPSQIAREIAAAAVASLRQAEEAADPAEAAEEE